MSTNGKTPSKGCLKVRIHMAANISQLNGCINVLLMAARRPSLLIPKETSMRGPVAPMSDNSSTMSVRTVTAPSQHRRGIHDWIPKQCQWLGCNDITVFEPRSELRLRTNTVHHDHLPTQCWVCDLDLHPPSGLTAHVRRAHPEITEDEIDTAMPFQKAKLSKQMQDNLRNAHTQGVHRNKSLGNDRSTHSIKVKS